MTVRTVCGEGYVEGSQLIGVSGGRGCGRHVGIGSEVMGERVCGRARCRRRRGGGDQRVTQLQKRVTVAG